MPKEDQSSQGNSQAKRGNEGQNDTTGTDRNKSGSEQTDADSR